MRILYVTANVLGDSGANAAEIFPKLAVNSPQLSKVIVADYLENKRLVRETQGADFLKLKNYGGGVLQAVGDAARIARKAKSENIDIIHVFYRQQNAIMIVFLRLALLLLFCRSTIIMDHRSVNLARGIPSIRKKLCNAFMQLAVHRLAGNPLAVETNHWKVWKASDIIDLGYDDLPDISSNQIRPDLPCAIWFVGSLRPRNRKSEFLIEVFERLYQQRDALQRPIEIHVAGPARPEQQAALKANPFVSYHGNLSRRELYQYLRARPGVGVAFMNKEFHAAAPSLKFVEYAVMQYAVIASDTPGLRMQGSRMNLSDIIYVPEDQQDWADALVDRVNRWNGLVPVWQDAPLWSYGSIFERQVIALYERLA